MTIEDAIFPVEQLLERLGRRDRGFHFLRTGAGVNPTPTVDWATLPIVTLFGIGWAKPRYRSNWQKPFKLTLKLDLAISAQRIFDR